MVPPPLPRLARPLRGSLLLPRARRDQPPGPPQHPERLLRRRDNESPRSADPPQSARAATHPQRRSRELRGPLREGVRRLAEPARLGRKPFPLKEVFKGVRSPGPAPSRALRRCREVHQPPEYPQTEPVQDLVRVIHPAAGLLHEQAFCPPHAVLVDGEYLAGLLTGGLREAQYAARVAGRVEGVAAELLVHKVLVGLGRRPLKQPEHHPGLRAGPGGASHDEDLPLVRGPNPEPRLPAERRDVLQPAEEPPRERAGRFFRLSHEAQREGRLLAVAPEPKESALLEAHALVLRPAGEQAIR